MTGEFHDRVLAARRACQQWEWSDALEAQGRARELLQPLNAAGPADAEGLRIAYAELLDELAEGVHEVVHSGSAYPVEPALKPELCWRMSQALRDRGLLPPPPPDWLAGVERVIVEEGFRCWRERAENDQEAHQRALELLERLGQLAVPAPGWLEKARVELSTDPASRAVAAQVTALEGVLDSLGALAAEGRTLAPELLGRLPPLAESWQSLARDAGGPFAAAGSLPAARLEDRALLLDLAEVEARALHDLLWPETARDAEGSVKALVAAGLPLPEGSATPEPSDLNAWRERMLGALTLAALWDEAALWGSEPEAAWAALPLLQALAEGSGRGPAWAAEPSMGQLRALLEGSEVVVVAAGAREMAERLGLERVRGVAPPSERCGYGGTLALLVGELEMLHSTRSIEWLVASCGVLRLPLLLELHLLHGIRGLAVSGSASLADLLKPEAGG